jgi:hypothetical protein
MVQFIDLVSNTYVVVRLGVAIISTRMHLVRLTAGSDNEPSGDVKSRTLGGRTSCTVVVVRKRKKKEPNTAHSD